MACRQVDMAGPLGMVRSPSLGKHSIESMAPKRTTTLRTAAYHSAWHHLSAHWYAFGLTVVTAVFVYGTVVDLRSDHHLRSLVREVGEHGGGLLLVMQLGECVQTLNQIDEFVATLQEQDVPVQGMVIKDNHPADLVASVLKQANQRFYHGAVTWRVVQPLLGRMGTPSVIAVGAEGQVLFVSHIGTILVGGAAEAARVVMTRTGWGSEQ